MRQFYLDSIKKLIKENMQPIYNVMDGNPTAEDKFEKWMASKPDLSSHGVLIDLSDNRIVHALVFRYSDDLIYGTIADGGIDCHVFDLPKDTSKYFGKFKTEVKKKYNESILNEDKCKRDFEVYLTKNFLNL